MLAVLGLASSHMHMKRGARKPFIEGGPRFHTDTNKLGRLVVFVFFGE